MKIHFGRVADGVYLRLDGSEIVGSEEVHTGIVLDFDKDNRIFGIEVLRVQRRLPAADLDQIEVKVV